MSTTPRTDAEAYDVGGIQHPDGCVVPARLARELETELERLKTGITTLQTTMIVDGNDMIDWGWTTIQDTNRLLKEARAAKGQP